jgi:hypothetical protein
MRVAVGWCVDCSDLSVIEIKQTDMLEAELAATVARQRIELAAQLVKTPSVSRCWQLIASSPSEVIRAEFNLSFAEENLASLRQLLPFMQPRQSGGRCLACQSEQCFLLPAHLHPRVQSVAFTLTTDCIRVDQALLRFE